MKSKVFVKIISLAGLLMIVIPCLYIVLSYFFANLFNSKLYFLLDFIKNIGFIISFSIIFYCYFYNDKSK